jgi:mRNA-degrading endonuclease toxin of MazEF toxin-antitoxin module
MCCNVTKFIPGSVWWANFDDEIKNRPVIVISSAENSVTVIEASTVERTYSTVVKAVLIDEMSYISCNSFFTIHKSKFSEFVGILDYDIFQEIKYKINSEVLSDIDEELTLNRYPKGSILYCKDAITKDKTIPVIVISNDLLNLKTNKVTVLSLSRNVSEQTDMFISLSKDDISYICPESVNTVPRSSLENFSGVVNNNLKSKVMVAVKKYLQL